MDKAQKTESSDPERMGPSGGSDSGRETHDNDSNDELLGAGDDTSVSSADEFFSATSGDDSSVSSAEGLSDGSGGEDTDSASSAEGILGDSGSSDSEEDEIEEIPRQPRRSFMHRLSSSGSIRFAIANPNPAMFSIQSSILSFIGMVAVSYMLNGNMSGLASFLNFYFYLVGIHAFRTQIMPRVREYVMNHPALQIYIGPVIGVHRLHRDSLVAQLRGPTEVNIAAITINLLVSGLSGFLTARGLELGALSGVGGSAVYYFLFNRVISMVASYIDNGSEELRNRIINALAMFGSEIRDRVGVQAVLRWVRESIPRSQDPLPSRPGEAVRRQELQERGADTISIIVGSIVFFSNMSGSGIPWAAILASCAWGGIRLPILSYMGLMRMAQQAEIRERFQQNGNNNRQELARALVLGGSATFFWPEGVLATIGILGGRLLGIMKWIPLILISKSLPASGQKMLLSVIGANVAASTINLVYAVEAILNPDVPPEDVLNRVHDNSPVGKAKRALFFLFWIFVFYAIAAIAVVASVKECNALESTQSLNALYAGTAIFGVVFMVIMTLIIYSNIDSWAQKAEKNCCIRPLLKSACFRGWWGYTGGSEGQTPEERKAAKKARRIEDAIVEEEENIGMRGNIRDTIRRQNRRAPVPLTDQNRIISLQDGTNMTLSLIGDTTHLNPNPDFLIYRVEDPPQDPNNLHIREVRISTREDNYFTLAMSDGRSIVRYGGDVRIVDSQGNEESNSATEPAEGQQLNLQEFVENLIGAADLSPSEGLLHSTSVVEGLPLVTRRASSNAAFIEGDTGSEETIDVDILEAWDGDDILGEAPPALLDPNEDESDLILPAPLYTLLEEANDDTSEEEDNISESEQGDEENEGSWVAIDIGSGFTAMDYVGHPEEESHKHAVEDTRNGCCSGFWGIFKSPSNSRTSIVGVYENQPPASQIAVNIYEDDDDDDTLPDPSTPLLGGQSEEGSSFIGNFPGDDTDQDGRGGGIINPGHKGIKSTNPFALYEYFQDNTPEIFEISRPIYDFNLKLEGDEMDLFESEEDEIENEEEKAQMRDTIEVEIKVKDVHDYENDGPIKPENKKREKVIDDFDQDFFKTGPINPKRYDYFNHLENPIKGSHIGDPEECQYEMFGYCNMGDQLMGALLLAPMMLASSK